MNFQNEPVKCPLNPLHLVKRSKMDYHLIKCKQSFPPEKIQICPFNASHIMLKGNLEKHKETCPSRAIVEQGYYHAANYQAPPNNAPRCEGLEEEDEEDWGAGPTPAAPKEIQIGKNEFSYKPRAVKREMRQQQLDNFKAQQMIQNTNENSPTD